MNAREAFITLNAVAGIGPVSLRRLLETFGSAEAIFESSAELIQGALGPRAGRGLGERALTAARNQIGAQELDLAQKRQVQILTLADAAYPARLREIPDPPPALYIKGKLLPEDEAGIGVVGTRAATPYGLAAARRFSRGLVEAGITVVSGLAEGIDGVSHEEALQAGGRTLAVLGHGLSFLYPSKHRVLSERICESGALISEFPFHLPPNRGTFPARNRVISGLSLGVVVVEAPLKSGALITAQQALEQGRMVFAIPGPISSTKCRGTHALLKDGATLVETPQEILEELSPHLKSLVESWRKKATQPEAALTS